MRYAIIPIFLILATSWLTALLTDLAHDRLGWTLVNIFLAPIGTVRGLVIWAGVL